MRLLIYGGCHANAIKRILTNFADQDLHVDVLINYKLIASKKNFPYDKLKGYDYVIFNPIQNKSDYNTIHIEKYCNLKNIRFYKYPWIQWGGYWPLPKKRFWGPRKEWSLFYVKRMIDEYIHNNNIKSKKDVESFANCLFDEKNFDQIMAVEIEKTTEKLIYNEEQGGVDLNISDFIVENYKQHQLFLTPDHASTFLYKYIVKKLTSDLCISIKSSFYNELDEIQEGVRLPILPGVKDAIGLSFSQDFYYNKDLFGNIKLPISTYAKTHFEQSQIVHAVSKNNTKFKFGDSNNKISVKVGYKMLVELVGQRFQGHQEVKVISPFLHEENIFLYQDHWQLYRPSF